MNSFLITLLSLTVSGSLLAIIMLALKPSMKKRIAKAAIYYLWLIVLLRLVLPISMPNSLMDTLFSGIQTAISQPEPEITLEQKTEPVVKNSTTTQQNAGTAAQKPKTDTPPQSNQAAKEAQTNPAEAAKPTEADKGGFSLKEVIFGSLIWIWAAGAIAYFLSGCVPYIRLERKLKESSAVPPAEDSAVFGAFVRNSRVRVMYSKFVSAPMLIGIFSPRIIVPARKYAKCGMTAELQNILRHEMAHYRRGDLILRWFLLLVSSLHWFNPLMILVRREIINACELACDEAVIRHMSAAEKQKYGETLLSLAANKRQTAGILATPLCEGKNELKERLVNIMNCKTKSTLAAALSILLALALTGCAAALGAATMGGDGMSAQAAHEKAGVISISENGNETETDPLEAGVMPNTGALNNQNTETNSGNSNRNNTGATLPSDNRNEGTNTEPGTPDESGVVPGNPGESDNNGNPDTKPSNPDEAGVMPAPGEPGSPDLPTYPDDGNNGEAPINPDEAGILPAPGDPTDPTDPGAPDDGNGGTQPTNPDGTVPNPDGSDNNPGNPPDNNGGNPDDGSIPPDSSDPGAPDNNGGQKP